MEVEKKKINTGETGFYQQVISESVKVPDTQKASEKVANTVATFLTHKRMASKYYSQK